MLGQISQEALARVAKDPRYMAVYRRACETFDAYLAGDARAAERRGSGAAAGMLVAYFSMEYGLLDCLTIYSGGLGVLSGDHLKSASDTSLPLVGVGLLYQKGYLQQSFDADGWQQARTPVNDFYALPLTPVTRSDGSELLVDVLLGSTDVYLKVWRIDVGRVRLYLLDSNIPQNADPEHRDITSQLYEGGQRKRICQEIALGIGGLRALKELGLVPTVFHMNEGHSAFLAVERVRVLMAENKLSFEEAVEASRVNNVFTTHTPVPAGIDLFSPDLVHEFLGEYCNRAGSPFEVLLAMGRYNAQDLQEPFSMAVCAIRTSAHRNGVSRLHRTVSQQMWDGLWPGLPVFEVPISSVTNGVHLPSWINGDLAALYDQYLEPDWREDYASEKIWANVADIPDAELWEAHRRRKRRLVNFVRERAVEAAAARNAAPSELRMLQDVLDPDALTIGFARRFATYKRATLIFHDLDRLKSILTHARRPVQILIAGKAHPQDTPGRTLIREIIQQSRSEELAHRIVFVEDYGIGVARELVGSVDVWLNTPRRGEEACGTSGMKAGMNGVLNVSILDGWFDEAAESSGGWAIGGRDPYTPERDASHAAAIYSLLESEIAPLYYENREQGVPVEWMRRVKQSIRHISAEFNCQRMVNEYRSRFYEPANAAYRAIQQGGFQAARDRVRWIHKVNEAWPRVRFNGYGIGPDKVFTGSPIPLRAEVDLAGLTPEDVRVEALVGRVGPAGELEDVQVLTLDPLDSQEDGLHISGYLFGRDIMPYATGRLGFAVRVSPNHFTDPLQRPCNALLKWAGDLPKS
jgi:starch phosphorylase